MVAVLVFGLWACHILMGLIFIAPGLIVMSHSRLFASALKAYLPEVYTGQELEPLSFDGDEASSCAEQSEEEDKA